MNIPCSYANPCPALGAPFQNLSAEAIDYPDYPFFLFYPWYPGGPAPGVAFPVFLKDPPFDDMITQIATGLQQNQTCVVPNQTQSFCQVCNGQKFCYTIDAGRICGKTQDQANQIAYALASYLAQQYACGANTRISRFFMQLAGIPINAGTDRNYFALVRPSRAQRPYSLLGATGSLMANGIDVFSGPAPYLASLVGTPIAPGNFSVDIGVADSSGQSLTKTYPVNVLGITNPNISNGIVGTAFGYQLQAAGNVGAVTFQIVQGTTPDGLRMDSTGNITGVPTTAESVNFSVLLSDENSNTCVVPLTMTVASTCPVWANIAWQIPTVAGQQSNSFSGAAFSVSVGPAAGTVYNSNGYLTYTGSLCHCHVSGTYGGSGAGGNGGFKIFQDGNLLVTFNPAFLSPGSYDIHFDIQAGTNSQIVISPYYNIGANTYWGFEVGSPAGTVFWNATLANL